MEPGWEARRLDALLELEEKRRSGPAEQPWAAEIRRVRQGYASWIAANHRQPRLRCLECGRVAALGHLVRHQFVTNHHGHEWAGERKEPK